MGPFNYISLYESLPQPRYNPLWLTGPKAQTNKQISPPPPPHPIVSLSIFLFLILSMSTYLPFTHLFSCQYLFFFFAGGVTFLAAVIFVAGDHDHISSTWGDSDTRLNVGYGYGLALTFVAAILALMSGMTVLVFNKPLEVPSDQRSLSNLRHNDPVDRMHREGEGEGEGEEDPEGGFQNPVGHHHRRHNCADPPPDYKHFAQRQPVSEDESSSHQPPPPRDNGEESLGDRVRGYGDNRHEPRFQPRSRDEAERPGPGRGAGRRYPRGAESRGDGDPYEPPARLRSTESEGSREGRDRPSPRRATVHDDDSATGDLREPNPNYYSGLTLAAGRRRHGSDFAVDVLDDEHVYLGLQPENSSPPHYSSHHLYSQPDQDPSRVGSSGHSQPGDDYELAAAGTRPVSLHSYDDDRYGRQLSPHERSRPLRQTSAEEKDGNARYGTHARHSVRDVSGDVDSRVPGLYAQEDDPYYPARGDDPLAARHQTPHGNTRDAAQNEAASGGRGTVGARAQRHSRDVTEADIDVPSGLPPPCYSEV